MVYTDLKAAIQDYTENYEEVFAERLDTFIRQAENRIHHIVRLPPTRKNSTGELLAGNRLLQPPSDYLSCDTIVVIDTDEDVPLQNKEPEFIYTCFPVRSYRGTPRYYAKLDDLTLLVGPTPERNYPAEIGYFAYPQSITIAEQSYLGDRCESLLLYASLVEAYTFMKGEAELLAFYDAKFKEAVGAYKKFGDGRARKDSYEEPDARAEV